MLNAFGYLSCFKLCWHNRPGPRAIATNHLQSRFPTLFKPIPPADRDKYRCSTALCGWWLQVAVRVFLVLTSNFFLSMGQFQNPNPYDKSGSQNELAALVLQGPLRSEFHTKRNQRWYESTINQSIYY